MNIEPAIRFARRRWCRSCRPDWTPKACAASMRAVAAAGAGGPTHSAFLLPVARDLLDVVHQMRACNGMMARVRLSEGLGRMESVTRMPATGSSQSPPGHRCYWRTQRQSNEGRCPDSLVAMVLQNWLLPAAEPLGPNGPFVPAAVTVAWYVVCARQTNVFVPSAPTRTGFRLSVAQTLKHDLS